MNDNVLSIRNLTKVYGDYKAVNDVSLEIPRGSIFGLLGPNGAGKTSLIRMITNITRPDSGEILFEGKKLSENDSEKIGYLPEERGLYKKMNVYDQLLFLAQLKGLSTPEAKKRVNHWLDKFEIQSWKNKLIQELSKGMQQKVQFIAAVISNPVFLILDEPFSGLDPLNASVIKEEILQLHSTGTTIILSTHRMEQVEEFCDEIVLINKGRNVLQGKVEGLRKQYKENIFDFCFENEINAAVLQGFDIKSHHGNNVRLHFNDIKEANTFVSDMISKGHYLTRLEELLPTMNEIFIKQVKDSQQ